MANEKEMAKGMEPRLKSFLEAQMPQARDVVVSNLRRGGLGISRENWPFEAQWKEKGKVVSKKLIMRRDPVGSVLETEREPEFRTLKALEATDVPAPKVYWLDTTGKWLDRPFYIMERYGGINDRYCLVSPSYPEEARRKLARQFVEILAQTHRVDWKALNLSFLGVPQGPKGAAQAQLEFWNSYMNRQLLEPSPVHREVYYWLKDRVPEAERTTLVHADPRPGNWLFQGDKVVVMLDWEMVHLGDPTEDLGWVTQFVYAREHFAAGFWEEEDFVRYYEEKAGFKVRPENLEWWKVFATWKIWAIALTGVKSFCEGKSDRAAAPPKAMEWILANMIGL